MKFKTEIDADCEIEKVLPTVLEMTGSIPKVSKIGNDLTPICLNKSISTTEKFKTEIDADCEIEKVSSLLNQTHKYQTLAVTLLQLKRFEDCSDMKRKQALLNWKWDAVIDLDEHASDVGLDAGKDYDSGDNADDASTDYCTGGKLLKIRSTEKDYIGKIFLLWGQFDHSWNVKDQSTLGQQQLSVNKRRFSRIFKQMNAGGEDIIGFKFLATFYL
ncbi:hypothetical protein LXL04_028921 [Taraxacum kok-saghyz]